MGALAGGAIGLVIQSYVVDWYQKRWRDRVLREADRLDALEAAAAERGQGNTGTMPPPLVGLEGKS